MSRVLRYRVVGMEVLASSLPAAVFCLNEGHFLHANSLRADEVIYCRPLRLMNHFALHRYATVGLHTLRCGATISSRKPRRTSHASHVGTLYRNLVLVVHGVGTVRDGRFFPRWQVSILLLLDLQHGQRKVRIRMINGVGVGVFPDVQVLLKALCDYIRGM